MYASLQEWLNTPVEIHPFSSVDSAGDVTYGPVINTTCYPLKKRRVIVDVQGKEVVSRHTLYFRGTENISAKHAINYAGVLSPIKNIDEYFEHGAERSTWVVYI